MRNAVHTLLDWLRQVQTIEVSAASPDRLTVLHRRTRTEFDAHSRRITQGDVLVATFDVLRHVEISRRAGREGPDVWAVTLSLSGLRSVQVGVSTEDVQASIAAARISTITGRPVKVAQ